MLAVIKGQSHTSTRNGEKDDGKKRRVSESVLSNLIIIIIVLSNLVSQSNTKISIFLCFYPNKLTTDFARRSMTFSKLISSKSLIFIFFAL